MNYIILISLLSVSVAQRIESNEDEESCLCDVEINERRACSEGGYLSPDECRRNNCCHSGLPYLSFMAPSCYQRKESCSINRCKVPYRTRHPCGSWVSDRTSCEARNCCFDQRIFPYCYNSLDQQIPNSASAANPVQPPARETRVREEDVEVTIVSPNITYFEPDLNSFIELKCNEVDSRIICGKETETEKSCLERNCCWDPSSTQPKCFAPSFERVESVGGSEENMVGQFDEYMRSSSETPPEATIDTKEEIFYGEFSVVVECFDMKYSSVSRKLCPANNRRRCLDINCCWNGTSCIEPMTKFANNTPDIPATENGKEVMTDPDFWRPGTVDVHEDVESKQLTCDASRNEIPCGYQGISRSECINKGCCWIPEFALKEKFDMICSYPIMVDMLPRENIQIDAGAAVTFWGPWGTWSCCYATQPFSNQGQRVRWRECFQKANYQEGMDRDGDCRLQSEESETAACSNPTACVETHWTPWTSWSSCSFGIQERIRGCYKGDALEKNRLCETVASACDKFGTETEQQPC